MTKSYSRFFETKFCSPSYEPTRQQILDRLWGVLSSSDALGRMFAHTENRLNLFRAINRGSLILINTAKDLLKQDGCELFGRFMIALIAQATQERAALPENKRLPTIVYIDEAQDYFAEGAGIEQLTNTGRKYKVGVVISHQNLTQLDRGLKASLMASTAIKFAGGVSGDDAITMAREMQCQASFLLGQQKTKKETRFGVYIKNVTGEGPRSQPIPLGTLESLPRMRKQEMEELLADNRERYCASVDASVVPDPQGSGPGPLLHPPQPV